MQKPVIGELAEHEVRQIGPGGKLSANRRFSHLIVGDGFRLKETRGPDNHPIKLAVPYQRFHLLHVGIGCAPESVDNDRLENLLKDETAPSIMIPRLRI